MIGGGGRPFGLRRLAAALKAVASHRSPKALTSLLLLSVAFPTRAACPRETTLEGLVTCIRNEMPRGGSNGFIPPSRSERDAWRAAVRRMLDGSCHETFTDAENGKTYCVMLDLARGWGAIIVDPKAMREISHQAPHPIADSTTELQAVGVFKRTSSRSFILAGAHRGANTAANHCQSSYGSADVAHHTDNMFHAAHEELMDWYGTRPWYAIQWHGMAADTCTLVDVYLSHGRNVPPAAGDKITALKSALLCHHPDWKVETTGTGACTLNATDNTQGRLLNGVDPSAVCSTAASSYSGRFIHIEQDPGFRSAADWVAVIVETFPVRGRIIKRAS